MDNSENVLLNLPHHTKDRICTTRPAYRQGRKLTAVKVYTVNKESPHLIIYHVPAIKLETEVKTLCERFGQVSKCFRLERCEKSEDFEDAYHICYAQIKQARFAKKQLDDRPFFGSTLHVCYAPEMESVEETRAKLVNRRNEIAFLTGRKDQPARFQVKSKPKDKPKYQSNEQNIATTSTVVEVVKPQPSLFNPYSIPTNYPSQKLLELPGTSASKRPNPAIMFIPTQVRKKQKTEPSRIVFKNKPK